MKPADNVETLRVGAAVRDAAARMLAQRAGSETMPVVGHSMHPTFDGIEAVRVRFGATPARFGDIALFLAEGHIVVHRIVGRNADGYLTRGDGQRGFDAGRLDEKDLVGVITHLIWPDRVVGLDDPGSRCTRWLLALASRLAGTIRLGPRGPLAGLSLAGRARDRIAAPVYRGWVRLLFSAYTKYARTVSRLASLLTRPR